MTILPPLLMKKILRHSEPAGGRLNGPALSLWALSVIGIFVGLASTFPSVRRTLNQDRGPFALSLRRQQ